MRRGAWLSFALAAGIACSGQPADDRGGFRPPGPPAASVTAPDPTDPQPAIADDEPAPADPAPAPAVDPLAALSQGDRARLLEGPEDPPFAVDTHYIQSNETRHDLFFPYIEGIGGAFVGVGSDQSFTMIAHAKSELVFMLDIDTRVVDLHRIYEVLVPKADSPQELVDMFAHSNAATTITVLEEAFANEDPAVQRRILGGFRTGRETVYRHLLRVIGRARGGEPTSWLSDPDKFAHMQALYRAGRVRIMTGNLAGEASMRTAAAASDALAIPVRVLYMSNAEEYFKYTKDFTANIDAFVIDEKSVVLRTIYSKQWEHADLWAYQVQPLPDFRARLAERKNRSRNPMLSYAEYEGSLAKLTGGLSLVGISPRQG